MEDIEQKEQILATAPPKKRGRALLFVGIAALLVVIVVVASQVENIRGILGSRIVGGNAGVAQLMLPKGFHSDIFYAGLNSPRLITFSPDGTLFVAERGTGSIVALPDASHSGKASQKV